MNTNHEGTRINTNRKQLWNCFGFDVSRGLSGTAVALKAALQPDPARRDLLLALQALSLREGGLKRIARELVEMFPERLGTPTMHRIGCKPTKRLTLDQCRAIQQELDPGCGFLASIVDDGSPEEEFLRKACPVEDFLDECRARAEGLDVFLEELCCNPRMAVAADKEALSSYQRRVSIITEDDNLSGFTTADVSYFRDVLGALFEYQRRHIECARAEYVGTSIGQIVFQALDYVLETGRSALIEGNSGVGKSTALRAWCDMHPGKARYVQLSGIPHRTIFFRKLAKACGVATGGGLSAGKAQVRIEEFLQRTRPILIIDEGQYLWPQGKRVASHPELINWLDTACYNEGVPFVIAATTEFTRQRQAVEAQTTWRSEQLRRRLRRVFRLPEVPTKEDLKAVARKQLGAFGENPNAVELVVGYALASRGYFQAITDAIDDARLMARRAGRDQIAFKDLKAAICDWRAPSDTALQRVFDSKPEGRRRRQGAPAQTDSEPTDSAPLMDDHEPVHNRLDDGLGALRSARLEPVAVGDG